MPKERMFLLVFEIQPTAGLPVRTWATFKTQDTEHASAFALEYLEGYLEGDLERIQRAWLISGPDALSLPIEIWKRQKLGALETHARLNGG